MENIGNICSILLRLYNSNANDNDLDRLAFYSAYFRDLSVHNSWVRTTNFNNNFLAKAYLNIMDHQLVFRLVDAKKRCISNGTLASNPGLTVHGNLIHVFGVHDAFHGQGDIPAHQIISSLS